MDPTDISTFDDGTYEGLSPRNQERFEEEFNDNLDDFEEEPIGKTLRNEYNNKKEHLDLIKAMCAAFHPKDGAVKSKCDFKLLGTNPLIDVKDTPADAITTKPEYNGVYLSIICCEIGGERRGEWVENINQTSNYFESSVVRQHIKDRLGIEDRDLDIGYATVARDDDTTGMDFSVLNQRCNPDKYAVIECDTGDKWLNYIGGSFVHSDLQDAFLDEVDYSKRGTPIEYVVNSHPIFPIREIIYRIVKQNTEFDAEEPDEFDKSTFTQHYMERLRAFCKEEPPNSLVKSEVENILQSGLAAKILTKDRQEINTSKDYRVVYTGPRGPQYAKDAVKRRYFENMPAYEKGRKAFESTKENFDRDSNLGDYT